MFKRIISAVLLASMALCSVACTGDTGSNTGADTTQQAIEEPQEITFDVTDLLIETKNNIDLKYDFSEDTLGKCRDNLNLTLTGDNFSRDGTGLVGSAREAGALGFSFRLDSFPYTAKATVYASSPSRSDKMKTVMVGIGCTDANQRHTSGGIWFAFRDNKVMLYAGGKIHENAEKNVRFGANQQVDVEMQSTPDAIRVSANGVHITTITYDDDNVVFSDDAGNQITSCKKTNIGISNKSHGYFRAETNACACKIGKLSLQHISEDKFQPDGSVFGFKKDEDYSFCEKKSFTHAVKASEINGKLYADIKAVAKMFDFDCKEENGKTVLTRTNAVLSLTSDVPLMGVNGEEKPFSSPKTVDGQMCICIEDFVKIIGYGAHYDSQSGICTVYPLNKEVPKEKQALITDLYKLYNDVVYNYADVQCDTRRGSFEKAPYDQRLVGIAYSTWNRCTRTWWKNAWDTPLYGIYENDDEDLLRYHAELLAAADVDFVFVDWSNNTTTTNSVYEYAEDFRTIEQATYKMFEVWKTVPNAPKICLFVGPGHAGIANVDNGNHQRKVDQVYRDFVTNPDNKDMYFWYEGKPLLVCYGATPTQYGEVPAWKDNRFTVRWLTGYVGQQGGLFDRKLYSEVYWSWEERGAQTYTVCNGMVEAVTCNAATRGENNKNNELRDNGATLKTKFQRANYLGAKIVILTTWNEWTVSEQKSVDRSKDLEPSVAHGTFYYDLMREQIKKFKGKI